jgi:hypothetical protein
MNCTTCRYELSQCLDGRLPSGRRTLVMQHTAECADCGSFWAELQAAQRLTLQLQQPRVGADFRESLWARIQAGEGTPDAVFREPVPLLAKVRYALSGAAAAAALLCVVWLGRDKETPHLVPRQPVADADPITTRPNAQVAIVGAPAPTGRIAFHQDAPPLDPPLLEAQRLRYRLVADEAARQLDQRYAATTAALVRLDATGDELALQRVYENAEDFHYFGEVLLDMRDRKVVSFTDERVDQDLRLAVELLEQGRQLDRTPQMVKRVIAPAFRSDRLASVARTIATVRLEPYEEEEALMRLNRQRPEVFTKLFVVFGRDHQPLPGLEMLRRGDVFLMEDECGPSYVVPRSEVHEVEARRQLHIRVMPAPK